jgi:hypothetical protein
MSNANSIKMIEKEENKGQELNELEKFAKAHVTVVKDMPDIDENCPFLVKKLEDAYKTFEEAPLPEWLLKRMEQKD